MTSLYARTLGPAFETLPPALRRFQGGPGTWHGTAHLTQGNAAARRLVRLLGYPDTDGPVPLVLTISEAGDGERWHRDFDGRTVVSHQVRAGPALIAERLGSAAVLLAARAASDALHLPVSGARLGPLPVPAPTGGGTETAAGEAVQFDVTARLPGLGFLLRYRGTLTPAA